MKSFNRAFPDGPPIVHGCGHIASSGNTAESKKDLPDAALDVVYVAAPFLGKTFLLSFGQSPNGDSKKALSERADPLFEVAVKQQMQYRSENATNRKHQLLSDANPPMLEVKSRMAALALRAPIAVS